MVLCSWFIILSFWFLVSGFWFLVGGVAAVPADSLDWVFSMARPVWYGKSGK
jgi:hypothetical protein